MAFVLADAGATLLANIIFNNTRATGGNNLTLRIFATDVTPTQASTAGSFTEMTGGNYSAKTLTMGDWTVSTVGGIVQAAFAKQTYEFTGAPTTNTSAYGYYVTDADGVLVGAETFTDGPYAITGATTPLSVTPVLQISSGTPT